MKSNGNNLEILDKKRMQKLSLSEAPEPLFPGNRSDFDIISVKDKIVFLSGEFDSSTQYFITEKLLKENSNIQQQITPETEILICGKYPDWMLVEEARKSGVRIIFVDKEGEFFGRMATKLLQNKIGFPVEEPIAV